MKQQEIERRLAAAEKALGHTFQSKDLLMEALVHRSYANESKDPSIHDNDRLEYLGDAVLDMVIAKILYLEHPNHSSGQMTKLRSSLVNEKTLAHIAKEMDIGQIIFFGVGEEKSGGAEKSSVLADTYESLLAAVFLDGGLPAVTSLIERDMRPRIRQRMKSLGRRDAKSLLQEICAKSHRPIPRYIRTGKTGPDHESRYSVDCMLDQVRYGQGTGRSIKVAEQQAANEALDKLQAEEPEITESNHDS